MSTPKNPFKTKGERTRDDLVERAAALFNQMGYHKASMSDIMRATGLQKGGIYRHFESKQALALEAFDFAVREMGERFTRALDGVSNEADQLRVIVDVYGEMPTNPPVPGGCPLLNAAVEADDADPPLRTRVRKAMRDWVAFVAGIVSEGQRRGTLACHVDAEQLATTLISALEGAVMMSKLLASPAPMKQVGLGLQQLIGEIQLQQS